LAPVVTWIEQFKLSGPRPNALCVDGDERYLSVTSGYAIAIEYLQIDYERLAIVKSIS
jgi:hypothetical protein